MMATLTHSPLRIPAFGSSARAALGSAPSRLAAACVLAGALGFTFVSAGSAPLAPERPAAAKSGKLALARVAASHEAVVGDPVKVGAVETRHDARGRVVFVRDESTRTTTVARDAPIPLGAASVYAKDHGAGAR